MTRMHIATASTLAAAVAAFGCKRHEAQANNGLRDALGNESFVATDPTGAPAEPVATALGKRYYNLDLGNSHCACRASGSEQERYRMRTTMLRLDEASYPTKE